MGPSDIDEMEGAIELSMKPEIEIENRAKFISTYLPRYESEFASGADLRADIEAPVTVAPLKRAVIGTGIYVSLPEGYDIQVRSRSGLAAKNGVFVLNSPGTVDNDYLGEIKIILMNLGEEDFVVLPEMRIAQMIVGTYTQGNLKLVDKIQRVTNRGDGHFSSTGVM